jgi:hypothetical protein
VIQEEYHIEKAEQPKTSRSPGMIHDSIIETLGIRNLAFSKVLMLMIMGSTLETFDAIEVEDIKDTFPALGLGIVREKAFGCTTVADQIFKGLGHGRFKAHGEDNSLGTGLANIDLGHSSPTMNRDAIIMSRSDTEEGVSCNTFIPAMDIVGREPELVLFLHR